MAEQGLTKEQAAAKLRVDGPNEVREENPPSYLQLFLQQLNEPMIFVLFGAAAISMLLRDFGDTAIILVVIIVNALVGMIQEGKARKAIEALKKLSAPQANVFRDGEYLKIPARELVVGDVVRLEVGNVIPADIILFPESELEINESALTGESDGIIKKKEVYMSTEVLKGNAVGTVAACGMNTKIGKIAGLLHHKEKEQTPLQIRMAKLGKSLSALAVALCVLLFLVGMFHHESPGGLLLTSISLAVAAVPEGLPAIITIVLAIGVRKMTKKKAIVRKLPAVETLGCVDIICSDKTGTLTQNRMTAVCACVDFQIYAAQNLDKRRHEDLLCAMTLCNDAYESEKTSTGSPTEIALLRLGKLYGFCKEQLEKNLPRIQTIPFESEKKYMETVHQDGKKELYYRKGAADFILKQCRMIKDGEKVHPITAKERKLIEEEMDKMGERALRMIGFASRRAESEYCLLGIIGLQDPPRENAAEAVKKLQQAGIEVAMITGDHPLTAQAIARSLGIKKEHVYARVCPEDKVAIVKDYKKRGHIVAMTGDGVNDAPALHIADIGIAMGENGTEVAKNAADMVLADDNFITIEEAVEEGRGIYENIKKSILFLLSSNFGEIITMFTAALLGLPAPLLPCHILWINLITDSLPALALGMDINSSKRLMSEPPRGAKESLLAHGGWFLTVSYGIIIASAALSAFFLGYLDGRNLMTAQTYAFTVLGVSQLFHAVGMRDIQTSVFRMRILENPCMIFAFLLGVFLQTLILENSALNSLFHVVKLSKNAWLKVILLSAAPLVVHEINLLFCKIHLTIRQKS